eukprot:CAMPEP_0177654350 /NCGR_PEP_ID=MMETSP0447-20121125/14279_1 /TAXON_ID=0 /ORGANISM="Stygamoeba regulata, Strain BSH-02190019" /LENGTH=269 /DNA_ID=CAMNT_0019157981 /DNA_START=59 /DNA_END=868 /DNA_ORIENTATION=-
MKRTIADYMVRAPSNGAAKKVKKPIDSVDSPAAGSAGSGYKDKLLASLKDQRWREELAVEFSKPYFNGIIKFLEEQEKKKAEVYPPLENIFNAFNLTSFDKVKVVIIGQDPYHDTGQAHGLCFSVCRGVKIPPSLRNIYKELSTDIPGFKTPLHGNLESWAQQGILMLNATLTVEAHKANSHANCGWQTFTDAVISLINAKKKDVVFILWGGFAQKREKFVDKSKQVIISSAHPSPLSATKFFGCKVFSKVNQALVERGLEPIDWSVPA